MEAQIDARSTHLHALYVTATVEFERLSVTLEHLETRIARVRNERGEIIATLQMRGVDTSVLPGEAPAPAPTAEIDWLAGAAGEIPTPSPSSAIQITPFATTTPRGMLPSQPTFAETGPLRLRDITLARAVGSDDCASQVTTQFLTTDARIYIVARAVDVSAGTVITSRWMQDGVELVTFDFIPDFVIENACIWFYVEQVDFPFVVGAYTVQLFLNGLPATSPVPFTVVSPSG